MATIQSILNDINLRYKNTFTPDQIIVWMNEEQRELFEILKLDSVPFSFSTVKGQYLYPIPNGVEKDFIRAITYQIDATTTPRYVEVPFKENAINQYVAEQELFYTFVEDNFYFNIPGGPLDNRTIYVYPNADPNDMSSSNLNIEPSIPVRYQEILKLGTLKRIAATRKDADMYNNYNSDYADKIALLRKKMMLQQPKYHSTIDVMPSRRGVRGLKGRNNVDWSMIPNS